MLLNPFSSSGEQTCSRWTDTTSIEHNYTTDVDTDHFLLNENYIFINFLCKERIINMRDIQYSSQWNRLTINTMAVMQHTLSYVASVLCLCNRLCCKSRSNYMWHFLQLQQKSRLILQNMMRLADICRGDPYDLRVSSLKYGEAANVTYALVATCAPSVSLSVCLPLRHTHPSGLSHQVTMVINWHVKGCFPIIS